MIYNDIFKSADYNVDDAVEAFTEEIAEVEENQSPESVEEIEMGIVVDCDKLNVREEPNANSAVLSIIERSTEVMIDESESTDEFYKICTETSIEGFCMKKFIAIQS